MASSVSALSYLDPAAYASTAVPSASTTTESAGGVSATAQLQAIQQQGNLNAFLNDSLATAVMQTTAGIDTGTAMTTLVSNMLQQVLGAYHAQSSTSTSG
jgi:hypothetical protein